MPEFVELIEPSKLSIVLAKASTEWSKARAEQKTNLIPLAATFKGLCEHSDVKLPEFFKGTRTRTPEFEIAWAEACSGNPQYKTDAWVLGQPCDFSGWTVGTSKQKVAVTSYVEDSFYLPYDVIDNLISREEMFQKAYLRVIKGLIEKLDKIAVAKIQTYTGVNKLQDSEFLGVNGGSGQTSWKTTLVPRANLYPESFNSYVRMVQRTNRMESPSLYVGGALEMSEFVDGSMEKMKFGNMEVYSDLENFADLNISKDMFLISHGAIGVLNAWGNPSVPTTPLGSESIVKFSRQLPAEYSANGEPLVMDITRKILKRELATNQYGNLDVSGQCELVEVFSFRISFDFALNPLACQETQTGIIRFRSDNTLAPFVSPARLAQVYQYPLS